MLMGMGHVTTSYAYGMGHVTTSYAYGMGHVTTSYAHGMGHVTTSGSHERQISHLEDIACCTNSEWECHLGFQNLLKM